MRIFTYSDRAVYDIQIGYRNCFGRVSTGGILVVLFAIALVAAFLKPKALTKALVLVVLILMVVSILLVMNISFYGITLADVLLMIIPIALGIGFLLKAQLMKE